MSETCEICGRDDCEREYGIGSPSCYRLGYERLRAKLTETRSRESLLAWRTQRGETDPAAAHAKAAPADKAEKR